MTGRVYAIVGDASHDTVMRGARLVAQVEGCTCDVEVTADEVAPGAWHVSIAHDDWCPRLRAVQAVNN